MAIDRKKAIAQAENARRGHMSDLGNLLRTLIEEIDAEPLETEAGIGFTAGAGVIYRTSVVKEGDIIRTSILADIAGLSSATSDLDIIGIAGGPAHMGRIIAAQNGTILTGRMTCLELPASLTDIDLYAADEGTGEFEDGVASTLTETALITSGGAWTLGLVRVFSAMPANGQYLYLANGAADIADPFTTGKFLIQMEGYEA